MAANNRRVLDSRSAVEIEEVVPHADGPHTYMTAKVPLFDTAGEPYAVCGFSIDITDRKRVEEALRASRERLRRMVNIEGVGVLTFDAATGTLIDANDWFLAMSGFTREEVAARKLTLRTTTPPEHVEASLGQMDPLARTGRIGPYEKE